jgi:hypothetical protein
VGFVLVTGTLINAVSAGVLASRPDEGTTVARLLAWSFGVTTTGFAAVKVAIAVVLGGDPRTALATRGRRQGGASRADDGSRQGRREQRRDPPAFSIIWIS